MSSSISLLALIAIAGLATPASAVGGNGSLPNGVASGDTDATSTVLWARAAAPGFIRFEVATDAGFGNIIQNTTVDVASAQVPAKLEVAGLSPGTRHYYRATDSQGNTSAGTFKTAALPTAFSGFRMGVSGDWRGELSPYPSVKNADEALLDLWVSLGDTIYADVPSPAVPAQQCRTIEDYRNKQNEVYAARFGLNTLADLRASTSILATIDDHEVTNDFAGGAAPATSPVFAGEAGNFINETQTYRNGLQAFHEFNPIRAEVWPTIGDARTGGKPNLFRSRVYGLDAAVFNLDARSFRDLELPGVTKPLDQGQVTQFLISAFNPTRTMLHPRQRDALLGGLLEAQRAGVTWKFVMVAEPIQNLGVLAASDRFEGYAAERAVILDFVRRNNITNVVFVSADIHGTLVNNLTYQTQPGAPQIQTGAFDISTGSVAYDAPFGPTVAGLAFALNFPGALNPAVYAAIPPAQQEAYITGLINTQLNLLGYDPLGFDGGPLQGTFSTGGPTATNTYGWTEFNVDATTHALTVTTWGIPPYSEAQLLADPAAIASRNPVVISRFALDAVCLGDFNADGFVDFMDVSDYGREFETGGSRGDFNSDGYVDFFDVDDLIRAFERGC
jgi:alkaline phosphatase D